MSWSLPSLTTLVSVAFLAYMAHSLWSIASLFVPPASCAPKLESKARDPECLTNLLSKKPARSVLLFHSVKERPSLDKDLTFLTLLNVEDPTETLTREVEVDLPRKVRRNGTLYLNVFTVPGTQDEAEVKANWLTMIRGDEVTHTMVPFTVYQVPEAETFNLLGEAKESDLRPEATPVTHLRSKITISMMVDDISMLRKDIPGEMYYLMRRSSNQRHFLPVVYVDELSLRLRDLVIVNNTKEKPPAKVEFTYRPISYGKLRLFLQFTSALSSMHKLGFTSKDTDEVKGIFVDTNMALLLVTFGVSAIHLLFDFLAFKNEISFWRNKTSMEGLSTSTVLWRAFSQAIVFLYLMDEETSLLVLIPSGIAAVIEVWKVTKALKIRVVWKGILPKITIADDTSKSASEKSTEEFDQQSMKYLSYILYPLCIGGAVYSLVYTPHKSWWSWTIQSLVNGVYAFGFLFMLPQLFVNYKLKSVAHLPWRSFMYKAFNTFIDDLFAFIITMPTAHRVACFRDDVVFVIYLYQRYLYPVDKTRIDMSGMIEETPVGTATSKAKAD